MHRFQAIAHIGERAPHDNAHRVIEVRAAHLLFKANWKGFFGELIHQGKSIFLLQTVMKYAVSSRTMSWQSRDSAGRKYWQDRPAQAAHFIMPTLPETLFSKEIPASKQFVSLPNRARHRGISRLTYRLQIAVRLAFNPPENG